jgi:hypothetical protein
MLCRVRSELFEEVRNWLQHYCRQHGFEASNNLGAALRRKRDLPILKFNRANSSKSSSVDTVPETARSI